jgi:hypothetical protein
MTKRFGSNVCCLADFWTGHGPVRVTAVLDDVIG